MKNPESFSQEDCDQLWQFIQTNSSELLGDERAAKAVHAKRLNSSTSYNTAFVRFELTTGEEIPVFLKDFSFSSFPKDFKVQRRERELCVYRDLLTTSDHGTAEYYGCVWDEDTERFWLLLEFVDGREVQYHGPDRWIEAAAWLGRFHADFAKRSSEVQKLEFLVKHDVEFFSVTENATEEAFGVSSRLGNRLESIVMNFERLEQVMAVGPRTVVHGGYCPWNILISETQGSIRVCPIDWESAGFGSPFYDLALFVNDADPRVVGPILDAYTHEAQEHGLEVPSRSEITRTINAFRLFRVIHWLSRATERGYSPDKVRKLVAWGEKLNTLLFGPEPPTVAMRRGE